MENYTLEEHLHAEISGLSPYYSRVFDYFMDEYHHRTQVEDFAPENSDRRINYLKEMVIEFWGGTEEDLWGVQTSGLEFNLQADLDNQPELLEMI